LYKTAVLRQTVAAQQGMNLEVPRHIHCKTVQKAGRVRQIEKTVQWFPWNSNEQEQIDIKTITNGK
jgi:hypothetical protein